MLKLIGIAVEGSVPEMRIWLYSYFQPRSKIVT